MQNVKAGFVGAAILLAGCSFATDALWPSLTGDKPKEEAAQPPPASPPPSPAPAESRTVAAAPAAPLGGGDLRPPPVSELPSTGTFVGQKTVQLRDELRSLQGKLQGQNDSLQQVRHETTETAQRYHGTVAAITAKLQLGTTPGNPVLVSQWNAAQSELDRMSTDIAAMNTLGNEVASNAALASYILESARAAYTLAGAIDEDHRQLAILEDETNRTIVLVDRLLAEINEDVARQTAYVGNERANLTTLSMAIKNGELFGSSLFSRAYTTRGDTPTYAASATPRSGFAGAGREPLMVIRFDQPDVRFERELYTVASETVQNRPNAQFEIVAVSPSAGQAAEVALHQSQSKRNANRVLQALLDLGLPPSRITLSSTTSAGVSGSEVHVYVR